MARIKHKIWLRVSGKKMINGVEAIKIDGDVIEDIIELRDKKYLNSIKRARVDAKMGRVYTLNEIFG